jgi:hypothetical protein
MPMVARFGWPFPHPRPGSVVELRGSNLHGSALSHSETLKREAMNASDTVIICLILMSLIFFATQPSRVAEEMSPHFHHKKAEKWVHCPHPSLILERNFPTLCELCLSCSQF